jgi:ligand-binding SRPBCC domain-containing protein
MSEAGVVRIERATTIARPIEDVLAFHDVPENLRRITPGSLGLALEKLPKDLRPGAVFAYRLRRWPLDLRWEAVVSEYRPPVCFVLVQSRGDFLLWNEAHRFVSEGSSTRVSVLLTYKMRKGLLGSVANALYVRHTLEHFVADRLENVRELLERENVTVS